MGDRRADAGVPIHGGHALRYNALNWLVKADTRDAPRGLTSPPRAPGSWDHEASSLDFRDRDELVGVTTPVDI